jgi:hypothetical protein
MFSANLLLANGYVGCNVTTANATWYKFGVVEDLYEMWDLSPLIAQNPPLP